MTPYELHSLNTVLPRGASNATSIPALARMLRWSDREVREGIEQLITQGLDPQSRDPRRVPVVTKPTNPGVYVATTAAELQEAIDGIRGRALALLRRQRGLRLCREPLQYRPSLF
jgi:hypothetical protein